VVGTHRGQSDAPRAEHGGSHSRTPPAGHAQGRWYGSSSSGSTCLVAAKMPAWAAADGPKWAESRPETPWAQRVVKAVADHQGSHLAPASQLAHAYFKRHVPTMPLCCAALELIVIFAIVINTLTLAVQVHAPPACARAQAADSRLVHCAAPNERVRLYEGMGVVQPISRRPGPYPDNYLHVRCVGGV
jgi:hypothetical protein